MRKEERERRGERERKEDQNEGGKRWGGETNRILGHEKSATSPDYIHTHLASLPGLLAIHFSG